MGFCTAGAPRDPQAGHAMPAAAPPVAPPPPGALTGPDFAADALYPPGSMARRRDSRWRSASSDMREDVDFGPALKVQIGPVRQEIEAGLRQRRSPFARKPFVQDGLHPVQEAHV